jgi:hypothetical protein
MVPKALLFMTSQTIPRFSSTAVASIDGILAEATIANKAEDHTIRCRQFCADGARRAETHGSEPSRC